VQALQLKCRAYKSPALGSLFLMNNIHYVVLTVEQSEQLSHLGHGWVEKHKVGGWGQPCWCH
jgi:exocyst complex protein 7